MRRLESGAGYGARAQASQARVREAEETPTGPTTWLCLWWLDAVRLNGGEIRRNERTRKAFGSPTRKSGPQTEKPKWCAERRCAFRHVAFASCVRRARQDQLRLSARHAPHLLKGRSDCETRVTRGNMCMREWSRDPHLIQLLVSAKSNVSKFEKTKRITRGPTHQKQS